MTITVVLVYLLWRHNSSPTRVVQPGSSADKLFMGKFTCCVLCGLRGWSSWQRANQATRTRLIVGLQGHLADYSYPKTTDCQCLKFPPDTLDGLALCQTVMSVWTQQLIQSVCCRFWPQIHNISTGCRSLIVCSRPTNSAFWCTRSSTVRHQSTFGNLSNLLVKWTAALTCAHPTTVPFSNCALGRNSRNERSVPISGPAAWNALPTELRRTGPV